MLNNLMILAQASGSPSTVGGSMGGMLVPMILFMAIVYFMLLRPQQRKEKERKKTIESLRAGQRILFAGGLIGTITEARESTFMVQIADGVTIEIARGAVLRLLEEGDKPTTDELRG